MIKRDTLVVIPISGLANRLRVMATVIKLARETGKKLCIYWQANKYLNAEFNQLFEMPSDFEISTPPLKYVIWLKIKSLPSKLSKLSGWYLQLFKFDFIFLDNMAIEVWHNKLNLKKEVTQAENVFMCTCQELNYFDLKDYKLFTPKQELLESIEKISSEFSKHTLGIHIRATDNVLAKEHSPFPMFIKKIDEEITNNPAVTFFLSTDDESYQNELVRKYGPEKIIIHQKIFGRDSTQGIKDAVIDLFCLSKTSKIFGSYYSSFSYVAGRIGAVEVVILKK